MVLLLFLTKDGLALLRARELGVSVSKMLGVKANPLKTESPKIDAGVHSGWFSEGTRESRDVTLTAAGDTPSDSAVGWTLLPWRRPILSWGPGLPGEGRSRCGCGRVRECGMGKGQRSLG